MFIPKSKLNSNLNKTVDTFVLILNKTAFRYCMLRAYHEDAYRLLRTHIHARVVYLLHWYISENWESKLTPDKFPTAARRTSIAIFMRTNICSGVGIQCNLIELKQL